jgi:TolA-binding protein
MSGRACERGWEVDACLDERLDGAERAAFERHLAQCRACAESLAAGRSTLRAMRHAPTGATTNLEHRRVRAALLRKANERMTVGERLPWPRATWVLVAATAALSIAYMATRPSEPPEASAFRATSASAAAPHATYEVVDEGAARWTATTSDAVTRVTLTKGTASFRVERLSERSRFVVALPDGEIEVRGTRFVVEVEGGRTRRVSVSEGVVELRIGPEPRRLVAGEAWSEAGVSLPNPTASVSTSQDVDLLRSNAPPGSASAAPAHDARSLAGERFAEAMGAYTRGDYRRAEPLFAAFVREHPKDARAEDATFLRAEGLARSGDRDGAAAAARAYLAAFPRGLRRPEAERLAGLTSEPATRDMSATPSASAPPSPTPQALEARP